MPYSSASALARASASAAPPGPAPALEPWQGLLTPLTLAAFAAWLAVVAGPWLALWQQPAARTPQALLGVTAQLAIVALFLARERATRDRARRWTTLGQAACALGACAAFGDGMQPILLIPVAAQAALVFAQRGLGTLLLLANLAFLGTVRWHHPDAGATDLLLTLLAYGSFQAFAVLLSSFARQAAEARDASQRLAAELLATRELLTAGTRADERLRLSRELHDTAGHKLTALKVQLALLERRAAAHSETAVALAGLHALADELLADIRTVVGALRQHDGVRLDAALEALARAFPEPRVRVRVAPDALAPGLPQATALVRVAQEAITNAARHAQARRVEVSLDAVPGGLELRVTDDGRGLDRGLGQGLNQGIDQGLAGHGLTGMRERLDALGGSLALGDTPGGGLTLVARLPHHAPPSVP